MAKVYALIPARTGSKGIPNKNFRPLGGLSGFESPLFRAVRCATQAGISEIYVHSDGDPVGLLGLGGYWLKAGAPLHTDTCPMIDIVWDALARVPGEPDDIWLLVQPTQPLRTPEHLKTAITLLQQHQVDSVVSVVAVESPDKLMAITDGYLTRWDGGPASQTTERRQHAREAWKREGTVYAFFRKTVETYGNIYGERVRPLVVSKNETQALDTPEDWAEAERRVRDRERVLTPGGSGA